MRRTASVEDIYAGIEDDEASVPSSRRATIPVARPKHLERRDANADAAHLEKLEALKDRVRNEIEKGELTAAAVRSATSSRIIRCVESRSSAVS